MNIEPDRKIRWHVRLPTDAEIEDHQRLLDVKAFLRNLSTPRDKVILWLYGRLHFVDALLVDAHGNPAWADWSELERNHFDLWYREWVELGQTSRPQVKPAARERIRLLIATLAMIFPKESTTWGCNEIGLDRSQIVMRIA